MWYLCTLIKLILVLNLNRFFFSKFRVPLSSGSHPFENDKKKMYKALQIPLSLQIALKQTGGAVTHIFGLNTIFDKKHSLILHIWNCSCLKYTEEKLFRWKNSNGDMPGVDFSFLFRKRSCNFSYSKCYIDFMLWSMASIGRTRAGTECGDCKSFHSNCNTHMKFKFEHWTLRACTLS